MDKTCSSCKYWEKGKFAGLCKFMDMRPDSFRFPSFPHYTTENHTCPVFMQKVNNRSTDGQS
jgi:hypothetical protein